MNKVKELRNKKGWTVKQLAEKLNVSERYIHYIEDGRTPGMKTAKEIADLFGKTVDYIFFK